MATNTVILLRASDLLPGDLIDFCGDEYVDLPDHCVVCTEPAHYSDFGDVWLHTDDPEADEDHVVIESPRDMSLDSEGVQVYRIFTEQSFAAAREAAFARGESDYVSGLYAHLRPADDQVGLHTTEDGWITLPADHEVKVIERRGPADVGWECPICGDAEHPEGADLEAESRMLGRMGLDPDTGGEQPSWGELADAQGRVNDLVAEAGCIVKVIDSLA